MHAAATEALSHVPRGDKKRALKGWNRTQDVAVPPRHANHADAALLESDVASSCDELDRMVEWLRGADKTGVGDEHDDNNNDNDDGPPLPKTVGQVQNQYRSRARREEKERTRKAVDERQVRRAHMLLCDPTAHSKSTFRTGRASDLGSVDPSRLQLAKVRAAEQEALYLQRIQAEEDEKTRVQEQIVKEREVLFRLVNSDAKRVLLDRGYRDHLLSVIRHELTAGRDVLLENDVAVTGTAVGDTKLMVQQLTTQSLLNCVRDQDVVPEVTPSVVRLLLKSKVRAMTKPPGSSPLSSPFQR